MLYVALCGNARSQPELAKSAATTTPTLTNLARSNGIFEQPHGLTRRIELGEGTDGEGGVVADVADWEMRENGNVEVGEVVAQDVVDGGEGKKGAALFHFVSD